MPYSYFEWLQGFFIVHGAIGSIVHSIPLHSLEHCICTTTMTKIRPDRDANLVPPGYKPQSIRMIHRGRPLTTAVCFCATPQQKQAAVLTAHLKCDQLLLFAFHRRIKIFETLPLKVRHSETYYHGYEIALPFSHSASRKMFISLSKNCFSAYNVGFIIMSSEARQRFFFKGH